MKSERRRAVVLVLDGLGSGYLGPYGNTWLETPLFNELAQRGLVLEHAMIDSPQLAELYRSLWCGTHAADGPADPSTAYVGPTAAQSAGHLLTRLASQNRIARLVTDEPEAVYWRGADQFEMAHLVPLQPVNWMADEPEQTAAARLVAAATEAFESPEWDLLWIHARGMYGEWDAPEAYRLQFCDEEDPPPPLEVHPPLGPVPTDVDPDWLQGWTWAYSGQVSLWDWCLRPLYERWGEAEIPTLWIILGARGFALGEHGEIGENKTHLHSELLQVPLIIVSNDWQDTQARCQPLVQPAHVHATLVDWFELPEVPSDWAGSLLPWWQADAESLAADNHSAWPELAVARDESRWAFRTASWLACLSVDKAADVPSTASSVAATIHCQLFLKPDDRWDVNDVADRCHAIVAGFTDLHRQWATTDRQAATLVIDPKLLVGLA